jgi:hypothetical protein
MEVKTSVGGGLALGSSMNYSASSSVVLQGPGGSTAPHFLGTPLLVVPSSQLPTPANLDPNGRSPHPEALQGALEATAKIKTGKGSSSTVVNQDLKDLPLIKREARPVPPVPKTKKMMHNPNLIIITDTDEIVQTQVIPNATISSPSVYCSNSPNIKIIVESNNLPIVKEE